MQHNYLSRAPEVSCRARASSSTQSNSTSHSHSHLPSFASSTSRAPTMTANLAAPAAVLLLLFLAGTASAANFTCAAQGSTCQSAIGYVAPNATTYGELLARFNTSTLADLLGANNRPPTTPSTARVPAKTTVRIPFRCLCAAAGNGTGASVVGRSDRVPIYTVQPNDWLDAIARNVFDAFVTFQEIADANNIPDPGMIGVGQKVWIPLPCSCDQVLGSDVMHYAHIVAAGETTSGMAATFGVLESTLLSLNKIADPNNLLQGQILDVPLPVCASSISSTSADHNLRLPNGTYALTAQDCIRCSCSSNTYQLTCTSTQGKGCPAVPPCNGTLKLGQTNGTGCGSTTCAYSGYSNSSSLSIQTTLVSNQTTACQNSGSQRSEFSGSMWRMVAISFHMVLILICFL